MAWLDTAHGRLHYTQPGRGDAAPALLLLHGAGGSRLDWPRALQRLPGRAVYNLDLPGHGRSPGPAPDNIPAYAAAVRAAGDTLDQPGIVLAGHSMGGAIAQTLALDPPPWLRGLVLIGTSARLRVAPALLEMLAADPAAARAVLRDLSFAGPAPAMPIQTADPAAALAAFRACDAFDLRDRLGEIRLPTLVIAGAADQLTPLKHGRALAEGLPDARLVILPGAGHFLALEAPQATATAVARFLDELTPA